LAGYIQAQRDQYAAAEQVSAENIQGDATHKLEDINPIEDKKAGLNSCPTLLSNTHKFFDDVAVIGISCKFPGVDNIEEFWDVIANGKDTVGDVPKSRWNIDEYFDKDIFAVNKTYSKRGGFINDVDQFDPLFFNISPKEATMMDPQQRLFLEHAWWALEDAACNFSQLSESRTGVYVGVHNNYYFDSIRDNNIPFDAHNFVGNDAAILSARLAYFLNLKGQAITINTACSSSLVALHMACEQLRMGQLDMALAGGVFLMPNPQFHILMAKGQMLSARGVCNAFDDNADGMVPSEGLGIVVLKPLQKAISDGDHIYGVIKASALNPSPYTHLLASFSACIAIVKCITLWRPSQRLLAPGSLSHFLPKNPPKLAINRTISFKVGDFWGKVLYFTIHAACHSSRANTASQSMSGHVFPSPNKYPIRQAIIR
jgi:Beta-ketoacyl synthase, N-terminal domain